MRESYNTTGVIRTDIVYVPYRVRKALDYIARANGVLREELVETILSEWVKQNWPKVVEFMDRREIEEKDFRQSITQITPTD